MAVAVFVLNGARCELASHTVESSLLEVVPEPVRSHAVKVNGTWYPVKQAFERAMGVPRSEFTSQTARRHLKTLGFALRGASDAPGSTAPRSETGLKANITRDLESGEWHTEANVQAAVVTALALHGYRVQAVANTATKAHGIDVIASREGTTVGVEVKGFPSKNYADPRRAGEQKPTSPSTQARHWFASAVVAAMKLRGHEPEWISVIALPDFRRYRDLFDQTKSSLAASRIAVWWVDEEGAVEGV